MMQCDLSIDDMKCVGDDAAMNRHPGSLLLAILLVVQAFASAQTPRDTTVEITATVQESPPQIALNWLPTTFPITLQKVFRKATGASTWTDIATLANSATAHVDTGVAMGISYEYFVLRIFNTTDPGSASGYVNAGIRVPLVNSRGRVLLLVDTTIAGALATELDTFVSDLIGDGWVVSRQNVPRNGTSVATKAIVQTLYNESPAITRSLILFGHVPVPYSGDLNPDGHPDHRGAWPADSYYADLDGVWTDTDVNNVGANRPENQNVPGDGKFDQSGLPSNVELEVGRIDLANLFSASPTPNEVDLLRQYLNRDHAFRFKSGNYANVPRRGLIADNFAYFGGEAFAASGWRNFTAFFGSEPGAVVQNVWFPTLENGSYLCAYGCGPGNYYGAAGVAGTIDFSTKDCRSVFNLLFGSYFGDWDVGDSFLRAPLAGRPNSLGLVSAWAGRPHWHLYHMALGETVGYSARTTMNNVGFSSGGYVLNAAGHGVHIALMGDPTLRLHPVLPPAGLTIDSNPGLPSLSWAASTDTNIEGYGILRATSAAGPFSPVSGSLVTGTAFVDRSGTPGQTYHYQVRTVKLETSASGTYLNSSQGIFGMGSFLGPVSREIQMTGNGLPIPNGDPAPSANTGTDFGSAEATVGSVFRTFAISNEGTGSLSLLGSPAVQISGPGTGDFFIVLQPASTIGGASGVTFQVRFSPTATGRRSATVSIASDDADEASYQFAIEGTGLPLSPEIAVSPALIAGTVAPNGAMSAPISVGNSGAGALHHTVTTSQAGYTFRDSNSFGGPGYAWIEISATGSEVTAFSNPDDGMSADLPIGFSFPFYGNNFSSLRVCTNAFISFGNAVPLYFGTTFPSIEASGNIVAAFWNDLVLDASGHVYSQQIGDLFVVQFENILRFGTTSERVTCQIVLRQTGEIFLQYKQVPAGFTDYSVGIQDGLRSQGLQVAYHTAFAQAGLAVRIVPPGYDSWLASNPSAGTVASLGSQVVNALINANGLPSGRYFAQLHVNSDDADEARVSIPVELTVSGPEVEPLGNGLRIASGDVTPMVVDGTSFGMVAIAGGSVARTFTIRNSGADPLTLGSVGVTGAGFSVTAQPASSVAASGMTSFVVTFAPTVAGAVAGTVGFATNDADEASYSFAVSGLALSPIESWRLTHFNTIGNAGSGADLADPDGDGLLNLAEYGFTLDPIVPTTSAGATGRVNGSGYLEIQFARNTGRTDLTYTVEASSNLGSWVPIASSTMGAATVGAGAHSVVESGAGAVRTVTVEDSQAALAGSPRFLRVKMVRN